MTPADTRMVAIVHEALRRDLRRTRRAVTTEPPPPAAQRSAIAAHVAWLMQFLHEHHAGEDDGLFPAVRRHPDAGALLDELATDHQVIAPAIARLEKAAAEYGSGSPDPTAVIEALDELEGALLDHLRREEVELLPLVSAVVSDEEWRRLEREHFLEPKSFRQLGYEGQWLLDGLAADQRAVVTGVLPPGVRQVMVHGFARGYRRRREACWGRTPGATRRVQAENHVAVEVDAPVDAVWQVVRDVTRIGEWSHECVGAVWLDGSTEATPGARFRGRTRAGMLRWGRICEVVSAEPHVFVWRTVPTRRYPDVTEWTIQLLPTDGGGTRIEQAYTARAPAVLAIVYGAMVAGHRDRTLALIEDLRRLGEVAVA